MPPSGSHAAPGGHHAPPRLRLLILADPGLPSHRLSRVRARLEHGLARELEMPVAVRCEPYLAPITSDNTLDVADVDAKLDEEDHADLVVLFTEMPRHDTHAVMAEVMRERRLAVLSWPALGVLSGATRLTRVLAGCVLQSHVLPEVPERVRARVRDQHWAEVPGEGDRVRLRAPRILGGLRTVVGMVATNEPWRTAPKLSRALAAASATGAFGIFYSSIWQMSDALSTPRLLGIGVLAMVTMVAWLLVSNRLWEKPKLETRTRVELLYNLSTVLTMLLCVAGLYLVLALLILVGGLVVIDPHFMAGMIEHPVDFGNYLDIAWLSAAMGVVAGALGSSFDSEDELRRVTHGRRELDRLVAHG